MAAALQRNIDLLACLVVAVAAALIYPFFPDAPLPLRGAVGMLLVLLAPGYALMAVLFPAQDDLDGVERFAGTFGLSIAAIALMALVSSYATPWGLEVVSVALSLSALTVVAAAGAWVRRALLPPEQRYLPLHDVPLTRGLVLAVAGGAFLFASFWALQPRDGFTEFYLLSAEQRFEGYPVELEPGEAFPVTVVVANREGRRLSYAIAVEPPIDAEEPAISVPELSHRQSWRSNLELRAPTEPGEARLTLELFRHGDASPYRTIYLNVRVRNATSNPDRTPSPRAARGLRLEPLVADTR